jgi:hypothetical protein
MTLGGGVAAATGDRFARRGDGDDDDEGNKDGDTIDPVSGYPATDIADVPERLVPAHEVALEIAPLSEPAGRRSSTSTRPASTSTRATSFSSPS